MQSPWLWRAQIDAAAFATNAITALNDDNDKNNNTDNNGNNNDNRNSYSDSPSPVARCLVYFGKASFSQFHR